MYCPICIFNSMLLNMFSFFFFLCLIPTVSHNDLFEDCRCKITINVSHLIYLLAFSTGTLFNVAESQHLSSNLLLVDGVIRVNISHIWHHESHRYDTTHTYSNDDSLILWRCHRRGLTIFSWFHTKQWLKTITVALCKCYPHTHILFHTSCPIWPMAPLFHPPLPSDWIEAPQGTATPKGAKWWINRSGGKEGGWGREEMREIQKRSQRRWRLFNSEHTHTHTHMKRLMMGLCDHTGELLFLGAVKVFTGQQNLIDRHTPPLYKDSS